MTGREAIRTEVRTMIARAAEAGRKLVGYRDVAWHVGQDPRVGAVEFTADRTTNGAASRMSYIWVLETRGEEIVRLRDYYDSAKALALTAR
jgi:ketosteroid isomerase-like protein